MKIRKMLIKLGQFLCNIFTRIPSNAIITKTLTGVGATTLEIETDRNSIICEANVPVIKGKVAKYKAKGIKLLGVYSGISDDRIIEYITSEIPFKKIITTPESYVLRVKPLLELYVPDYLDTYFFLYDESEKTIQDVGYRETITAPLEDMFKFKDKALITATPIHPSDPRFVQHDFRHLLIEPDYDYSFEMTLTISNNVLLSFRDYLKENESECYCIFLNSTDAIYSIIKYLKLEEDCQVFCGKKSVKKLKKLQYKTVYNDLRELTKYNFFTSSFFSAVDIDLEILPNVVIITDLFFAEQSIIDPATEAVQIKGRFRKGINSITHITNINAEIKYQTREEIMSFLNGCHEIYSVIHTLYSTAVGAGQRKTLQEALKLVSYSKYVDKDGRKNYFMIDNKLDEDMVRSYYSSAESLKNAYSISKHFKAVVIERNYPLSDEHRFKRTRAKDDNELFKSVFEQYIELNKKEFMFQIDDNNTLRQELYDEHPELYTLCLKLDGESIINADYKIRKVKMLIKQLEQKVIDNPAISAILREFKGDMDKDIPVTELSKRATPIKIRFGIKKSVHDLLDSIFILSPRSQKTIDNKRVWTRRLSNPKFLDNGY